MYKYTVIKSDRKTASIEIKAGEILFRVPKKMTDAEIKAFGEKHSQWIEKHLQKQKKELEALDGIKPLSDFQLKELAKQAMVEIPPRVELYAKALNVDYGKITIRNQKTRWGSCSSKRNLSFNCLLMLAPKEVLDSVIVHEICHCKEMNHSERFYSLVLSIFPDYYIHHQWLKDNGGRLLRLLNNK